ncbi:MAG: PH domain-containing protein [Bryobacteraceae bacterium]
MSDMVVQPTMKFIKLRYAVAALALSAGITAQNVWKDKLEGAPEWLIPAVLVLLFLWPLLLHIRRQFTKITIAGDKLRYETGMLSKTTRSIQISKVQDVRVDQKLAQRLAGVGNLSIETAGESSRLTVTDIDSPLTVADQIMEAAHQHSKGIQGQGA